MTKGLSKRSRAPRIESLIQQARGGDTSAACSVGYAYDVGVGIRRNEREALRWYRRAYRDGSSTAANNISTIYRDRREFRRSFQWMTRAVRLGDGDAAVAVGYRAQYGIGTRKNIALARRIFRRAMRSKDITGYGREEAMYHMALTYLDEEKREQALPLLRRASVDRDYPEAQSC